MYSDIEYKNRKNVHFWLLTATDSCSGRGTRLLAAFLESELGDRQTRPLIAGSAPSDSRATVSTRWHSCLLSGTQEGLAGARARCTIVARLIRSRRSSAVPPAGAASRTGTAFQMDALVPAPPRHIQGWFPVVPPRESVMWPGCHVRTTDRGIMRCEQKPLNSRTVHNRPAWWYLLIVCEAPHLSQRLW